MYGYLEHSEDLSRETSEALETEAAPPRWWWLVKERVYLLLHCYYYYYLLELYLWLWW